MYNSDQTSNQIYPIICTTLTSVANLKSNITHTTSIVIKRVPLIYRYAVVLCTEVDYLFIFPSNNLEPASGDT